MKMEFLRKVYKKKPPLKPAVALLWNWQKKLFRTKAVWNESWLKTKPSLNQKCNPIAPLKAMNETFSTIAQRSICNEKHVFIWMVVYGCNHGNHFSDKFKLYACFWKTHCSDKNACVMDAIAESSFWLANEEENV